MKHSLLCLCLLFAVSIRAENSTFEAAELTDLLWKKLEDWRLEMDSWKCKYRVKIIGYLLPTYGDDGKPNFDDLIDKKTTYASVSVHIRKRSLLEQVELESIYEDDRKIEGDGRKAELLIKDGESVLYNVKDGRVWIRQGVDYTIPYLTENIEKPLLLEGYLREFISSNASYKASVNADAYSFIGSKSNLAIEFEHNKPKKLQFTHPGQLVVVKYAYDDKSPAPMEIDISISSPDGKELFGSVNWHLMEAEYDHDDELVLKIPEGVFVDDKRSVKRK